MKTDFKKEFKQAMTEEKEIPSAVRKSLDSTYASIRTQSKMKKNRFIWKRVTAAACALLFTGILLTNERVIANINEFFKFGDKGIERALDEGFAQDSNSSASDQDVTITLQQNFSDANKIGMSFQLEFEDPRILDADVTDVTMDFRLKNGDGEYVDEFIPDTKPLKGTNKYDASGIAMHNPILNAKTGKVQFDVIIDSNKGMLPCLQDAVVEIESINVFRVFAFETLKKIDGKWDLAIMNQDMGKPMTIIEYTMDDPSSIIQVSSAKASPTSLNLIFSVDEIFDNESPFSHSMKFIDKDGNEYLTDGFNMDEQNNQTIIAANFPITAYHNAAKITFVLEGIGEVKLLTK
ncbi:DUF4179 domain-containing protein [Sporosarcina sp. ANT_H38]|uniref:DUF4179 domain-containing protein n=1 Tax=Sporosarcina sp. ANT_H38 TaxID=2597358 RepID=UPI0011F12D1D|nr:DUF4179 domain-containing protein [Sporosarcina sp. ANT_H38]KAA0965755.1 DUF4179 domain-containing protein [Sporosarcina sp. ANT_H38]